MRRMTPSTVPTPHWIPITACALRIGAGQDAREISLADLLDDLDRDEALGPGTDGADRTPRQARDDYQRQHMSFAHNSADFSWPGIESVTTN
jgi:hypothetical protein